MSSRMARLVFGLQASSSRPTTLSRLPALQDFRMLRVAERQHNLLIRSKVCSILDSGDQLRTTPICFQTKCGGPTLPRVPQLARVHLAIEMHHRLLRR
jgi:hypothetical protein